jgi:RimJ/RimL family protein N-acetyltransferase
MLDTPIAQTQRLVLRPWRVQEADRFFDMHRRMEVARWISGRPMRDRREAVALIERTRARLAADPRYGSWAIVVRASGVLAGSILLKPLPDGEGEIEIGWHLHPDCWGQGYAREGAAAVLRHGFATGLREVWAVTDPDNARSIAVCRAIGLRALGVTHRWYHEPSVMWWLGADAGAVPSIAPDRPWPMAS